MEGHIDVQGTDEESWITLGAVAAHWKLFARTKVLRH